MNNNDGGGGGRAGAEAAELKMSGRHQSLCYEAQLLVSRCVVLHDTGGKGGNKQSDMMMSR